MLSSTEFRRPTAENGARRFSAQPDAPQTPRVKVAVTGTVGVWGQRAEQPLQCWQEPGVASAMVLQWLLSSEGSSMADVVGFSSADPEPRNGDVVRCQIGPPYHNSVAAVVDSVVHHRCELADVDVSTLETLIAAVGEVVEDIEAGVGPIGEIAMNLSFEGVDLELHPTGNESQTALAFVAGRVAAATFDEIDVGSDGAVRVRVRFTDPVPT